MTKNIKEIINVGTGADSGDGDYMRKAGIKINHNFDAVFNELGDGNKLLSSGSFKTIRLDDLGPDGKYYAEFGDSIIADTRNGKFEIVLPLGDPSKIGQSIKIIDAYYTWGTNSTRITPSKGDSIGGLKNALILDRSSLTIHLFYTDGRVWSFNDSVYLNKITSGSAREAMSQEYLVVDDERKDFFDIFGDEYNVYNLEVYRRGNKLYYGEEFSNESEYGSLLPDGTLGPLDGMSVTLREPALKGDGIFFKSYTGSVEQRKYGYNSKSIMTRFEDTYIPDVSENEDGILIVDREEIYNNLETEGMSIDIPFSDFGIDVFDVVNIESLEIHRNGVLLLKYGEAISKGYHCVGAEGNNKITCEYAGGVWTMDEEHADFNILYEGDIPLGIRLYTEIDDYDIITIRWLNNVIGTVMGEDEIIDIVGKNFVRSQDTFYISKLIKLKDIADPTQDSVEYVSGEQELEPKTVLDVINMLYPIGTIYQNALNKENPKYILGFGEWSRIEGRVLAGFSEDTGDAIYGQNNNHNNASGNPSNTTGGTHGSNAVRIGLDNIPRLEKSGDFLKKTENGKYSFGSCMVDPDEENVVADKFDLDTIVINEDNIGNATSPFGIMQPTMIVSMWMRVE